MARKSARFVPGAIVFHTDESPFKVGDVIKLNSYRRGSDTDAFEIVQVTRREGVDSEGKPLEGTLYAARSNSRYDGENLSIHLALPNDTAVTTFTRLPKPPVEPDTIVRVYVTVSDSDDTDDE